MFWDFAFTFSLFDVEGIGEAAHGGGGGGNTSGQADDKAIRRIKDIMFPHYLPFQLMFVFTILKN